MFLFLVICQVNLCKSAHLFAKRTRFLSSLSFAKKSLFSNSIFSSRQISWPLEFYNQMRQTPPQKFLSSTTILLCWRRLTFPLNSLMRQISRCRWLGTTDPQLLNLFRKSLISVKMSSVFFKSFVFSIERNSLVLIYVHYTKGRQSTYAFILSKIWAKPYYLVSSSLLRAR